VKARVSLCALTVLTVLPSVGSAQVKERRHVVNFEVHPGEEPDFLCVTAKTSNSTDAVDSSTLANVVPASGAVPWFRVQGDPPADKLEGALLALQRATDVEQPPTCTPTFRAPASRFQISCKPNTQSRQAPSGAAPRVAVLMVESTTEEISIAIGPIALNGAAAVMHLAYAKDSKGDEKAVSIALAGGTYAVPASQVSLGSPIVLPLLPRCGQHTVVFPHSSAFPASSTTARLPAQAPIPFEDVVTIPYELGDAERELRIDVESKSLEVKRYVAKLRWRGARPPERLEPGLSEFRLVWERHCLFGAAQRQPCPKPSFRAKGVECTEDPHPTSGQCEYRCTADPPLPLPATVDFLARYADSNGGLATATEWEDTWTDQLRFAGEKLHGFTPSDERHVVLDFSSWPPDDRMPSGMPIDHVNVTSARGAALRVDRDEAPGKKIRLRVPGLRCNDVLVVRPVGTRLFEEQFAQVGTRTGKTRDNVIVVDNPRERAEDPVRLGLLVGGGIQMKPLGMSNEFKDRPYGALEGVFTVRDLVGPRSDLELRAGALVSQTWAAAVHPSPQQGEATTTTESIEPVWQVRIPIGLNYVCLAFQKMYFGVGTGIAVAIPILDSQRELTTEQLRAMATVFAGARVSPEVAFELGGRFFFGESINRYTSDLTGAPRLERDKGVYILWEARVRFDSWR
jgi:hypothetical protein